MYSIGESSVHFGSRQLYCGLCSVNIQVRDYAQSMSHGFDIDNFKTNILRILRTFWWDMHITKVLFISCHGKLILASR